jgi:hypothetical protein
MRLRCIEGYVDHWEVSLRRLTNFTVAKRITNLRLTNNQPGPSQRALSEGAHKVR